MTPAADTMILRRLFLCCIWLDEVWEIDPWKELSIVQMSIFHGRRLVPGGGFFYLGRKCVRGEAKRRQY
jgi:hypothetical protein